MIKSTNRLVRSWAVCCHFSPLVGIPLTAYLVVAEIPPIPFVHLLAPLLIWLLLRKVDPFINDQGRESLKFQVSLTLYAIAAFFTLMICLGMAFIIASLFVNTDQTPVTILQGLALLVLFCIVVSMHGLQLAIAPIAAIQAHKGELYRYPCIIPFLK